MAHVPFKKNKPITIKARLLKENFALFHKGFHENKTKEDPFYLKLYKLLIEQSELSKVSINEVKSSFNTDGFTFKSESTKYYNLKGKPCLAEECLDLDAKIKLVITPYDFIGKNKQDQPIRLIGLSIKALEIHSVKDKLDD